MGQEWAISMMKKIIQPGGGGSDERWSSVMYNTVPTFIYYQHTSYRSWWETNGSGGHWWREMEIGEEIGD